MREILFRGKRKDNGKWIYGDLNHYSCDDGLFIAENGYSMHRIDKNTVGQFTGLLDKNGTKIFEGDIVRCEFAIEPPLICQVVFQCFSFSMYHKRFFGENKIYTPFEQVKRVSIEVIGNIHDDPELMEK